MIDFNTKEKEAINSILINLMKVDGNTDLAEAAALFNISQSIGLSVNEADESLAFTFEEAKEIIAKMSAAKREYIRNLFNEMAISDGTIGAEEQQLIQSVFS